MLVSGPEVYTLAHAPPGSYQVKVNYYGSHQDSLTTGSTSGVIWSVREMGDYAHEEAVFTSVRLEDFKGRASCFTVTVPTQTGRSCCFRRQTAEPNAILRTATDAVAAAQLHRSLEYLVGPALDQLPFFTRALQFLDSASDELLLECVRDYHTHLLRCGQSSKPVLPSFEVELVWRAHLLRPRIYALDCGHMVGLSSTTSLSECFADGADPLKGIEHTPKPVNAYKSCLGHSSDTSISSSLPESWFADLVAKTRRDAVFMRQVLELQASGLIDRAQITAELPAYAAYLRSCTGSTITPVPSKCIDLLWHTHQFHPRRYAEECRKIAGMVIDHIPDDDGPAQLTHQVPGPRAYTPGCGGGSGACYG